MRRSASGRSSFIPSRWVPASYITVTPASRATFAAAIAPPALCPSRWSTFAAAILSASISSAVSSSNPSRVHAQDLAPVFSSIQRYAIALVAPFLTFTIEVSTFCFAKSSRIIRPSASSPTVPTNAARIPSAAAPAVEFAAGPPPMMAWEIIRTFVSIGINGNTARWSLEQKPIPM